MGLFDKRDKRKQSDDFDSPVEQIDLDAPPASESSPEEAQGTDAPEEPAAVDSQEAESDDEPSAPLSYGIQQAIELMRTLPSENVELVVRVVKHTLESTHIKISRIIDDATHKQQSIQGRIKVLKEEIGELEKEIATRRDEIGRLEADFSETSTVKERLILAERLTREEAAEAGAESRSSAGRSKSGTRPPAGRAQTEPKSAPQPAATRPRTATGSPPGRAKSPSQAPSTVKTSESPTVSGSIPEQTSSAAGKK